MPNSFHRAVLAGARAVPGFALGIALAAEQQGLAVLAARHQHQHRVGFGKPHRYQKSLSCRYGIVGVVAAHALRRGRQHQDRVVARPCASAGGGDARIRQA
ncbi:MAG: hypothetical protein LKM39_12930 [Chiayiivirga sp.]|jgi:ABC-type nickel/cobalt efflux system permease component RcnA|nr:hypothetical protein [Chiayiivirga sp.]